MQNTKLSPPWLNYVNEIKALFGRDPEISILYDDNANEVKLYVEGGDKANALAIILPPEKHFGNVTLKITVVPANDGEPTSADLVAAAFRDNPVLDDVCVVQTPFGEMSFAVFAKEVVQYYNDDLTDINGLKSTLYEDIARDVFDIDGINYCTSKE